MAGLLLVMMMGGTLPIPLYVLYEKQMGFGPLGVTVVFASYVVGTLAALVTLGDLSDHIGRRRVLATGVACATISTVGFLVASGIELLIAARIVSGLAAGFVTGTATAALAELRCARTSGRSSHPGVARSEQIARHRLGDARFAEATPEGTQTSWSQLVTVTRAS
jgi:MFS family permease